MDLRELLISKKEEILRSKESTKEAQVHIKRLDITVKLKDIGYDVVMDIAEIEKSEVKNKEHKAKVYACVNGLPEFQDAELIMAYNCLTPEQLIETIFTDTEISFLANRIMEFGGYDGSCVGAIEEIKKQ